MYYLCITDMCRAASVALFSSVQARFRIKIDFKNEKLCP